MRTMAFLQTKRTDQQWTTWVACRTGCLVLLALSVFWAGVPSVLAHNIDLEKARKYAQTYARKKRDDNTRNYAHFKTECRELFPGHNHYVGCDLYYWTKEAGDSRNWSCKEYVEVYLEPGYKPNPLSSEITSNQLYIKNPSKKQC